MAIPSILLIHGPATGAWIWGAWRRELGALGWQVNVLDLRGHGLSMPTDLATVTLEDYVADVLSVTAQIEAAQAVHPVVGGWSTGGLIAMMYAAVHKQTTGLLLLSPSLPSEVGGKASIDAVRSASGDVLGPEVFGAYPRDRARSRAALPSLTDTELDGLLDRVAGGQESGIAYRQVLRGVSVPDASVECPSLIVHGRDEDEGAAALAAHLRGEALAVPVEGRWGIVCHEPAVATAAPDVDRWLRRTIATHLCGPRREGQEKGRQRT